MNPSNSHQSGSRQRVVVVGATGLIGSAIVEHLTTGAAASRYEVIGVSNQTKPGLDLEDARSIDEFFRQMGAVDHVVVAAGDARFAGLAELDEALIQVGISSKLMGQVRVALAALRRLPSGGSVTLTSGALAHTPIPGSAAVALVNGAIDSFVKAIALDTPPGRRINAVSPGWIKETRVKLGLPPDPGTSAFDVGRLYVDAIEGQSHGQVLSAWEAHSSAA